MGFSMSLFATDQLPVLLPKIQKWLEVRFHLLFSSPLPSASTDFLTGRRVATIPFLSQVRTPNEGGILAFLTPLGGTPSILLGVTYNGAVEEGQRKIDDMVESESRSIPFVALLFQPLTRFQYLFRT